jgi:hypothetical protein
MKCSEEDLLPEDSFGHLQTITFSYIYIKIRIIVLAFSHHLYETLTLADVDEISEY